MFSRILIPLDGSALAERAIPHALEFARIFGADIVLLQVLESAAYHASLEFVAPLNWQIRKAEAEAYLSAVAGRMQRTLERAAHPDRARVGTVTYAIREGKIAENIIDFAVGEKVDLLAISTHGASGPSRWTINSVAQKVINLIYLPVLVVRAHDPAVPADLPLHYRRILLPIDSSRRAECVLAAGVALARGQSDPALPADETSQSRLNLAMVLTLPELPLPEPYPTEVAELTEQLWQVSRRAVRDYLETIRERLPIDCDISLIESHSVASSIHELAAQEDVDLVILSAHGSTGPLHWPYGNVTRNYIEYGAKPVLIIQDIAQGRAQPTAAQVAAEKSGRR
jgi:nucleotide-binding universal stress UspA family protein